MAQNIHSQWLGMLQPEGLVVSIPVLQELELWARHDPTRQQELRALCPDEQLPDLHTLTQWLGWPQRLLSPPDPDQALHLPDLGATLQPDLLLAPPKGAPILALQWTEHALDQAPPDARWPATAQERFERWLLARAIPIGVHVCPDTIRLSYAPAGQASGSLSFPVSALLAADGRILVDALLMLLGPGRLFQGSAPTRLPAVLQASRKRQEAVTVALADQVEDALRILIAGFDAANQRSDGQLLQGVDTQELYLGLTTLLLRLVFVLYAEDQGLLPMDQPLYAQHYSVAGLADQLRQDAVRHHHAMDRRFGATSRLLTLFRLVFDGGHHHGLHLPPRKGELFDPDAHPFLEGRRSQSYRSERAQVPLVDDGVWHQVLHRLMHLEGQRISYKNLEVEQIGSVYENLMGFVVYRCQGPTVALKPDGYAVDLLALRAAPKPIEHLAQATGDKPAKLRKALPELAQFSATDDRDADLSRLHTLLASRLWTQDAPTPTGRHLLVPGPERRHSGSHYTPRSLSAPIVQHTLDPLLGEQPTPEQILELRVCDPAMGSGAFLAETCRYLARRLVDAWTRTDTMPASARSARDPENVARRIVAERCLYGVDKNPRAVMLARLSLWLITSAADQPFTFVDHALREGDALIGLDLDQIAFFDLQPHKKRKHEQLSLWRGLLTNAQGRAAADRNKITATQTHLPLSTDRHREQSTFLHMAQDEIWDEHQVGRLLLACHWAGGTKRQKAERIQRMAGIAREWYPESIVGTKMVPEAEALMAELPMRPFHWALEFPEVFGRKGKGMQGFDAVVGNPPFGGQNTIRNANGGAAYIKLLQAQWPHGHGNADLAAWFFLRAAGLLREGGCFGLISTNTIAQGNTRQTGLQHMVEEEGIRLYRAMVDYPWPVSGAAVTVSVVHGKRGHWDREQFLAQPDGDWKYSSVPSLNSSLQGFEELPDPVVLSEMQDKSFMGCKVYGNGFVLSPAEAADLIQQNPDNAEIVRPYLGGQELNSDPECAHSRYVIDFGDRSLEACEAWPELLQIVRERVKPERDKVKNQPRTRDIWWLFSRRRPNLDAALTALSKSAQTHGHPARCLAFSLHSHRWLLAWQPLDRIFSHALGVVALARDVDFAILQSRVHEPWARQMGSTMETRLRYAISRCFETFPFPKPTDPALLDAAGQAGKALYDLRAAIMVEHGYGMTTVWNALHGQWPKDEPLALREQIAELAQARERMDRAVLAAYGWEDLDPDDSQEILLRLRRLNAERAAQEQVKG